MRRASLWRLFIVVFAGLVLAVTFSSGARAAVTDNSGGGTLSAAMLSNGDLPNGFQPYAPLTGPVNAQRAQTLGIDLSTLGPEHLQVRTWISPHHAEVVEIGVDAGTHQAAQAGVAAAASTLLKQGAVRQHATGSARSAEFGLDVQTSSGRLFALTLPMARGPYFFVLHVYVAASVSASASSLMSGLATAQAGKVPANTPDTDSGVTRPRTLPGARSAPSSATC